MSDNISLSNSLNLNTSSGPGKVRALFEARRTATAGTNSSSSTSQQSSPVGWDKSHPLHPIARTTATTASRGSPYSSSGATGSRNLRQTPHRSRKRQPRSRSDNRLGHVETLRPSSSRSRSLGAPSSLKRKNTTLQPIFDTQQQQQKQQLHSQKLRPQRKQKLEPIPCEATSGSHQRKESNRKPVDEPMRGEKRSMKEVREKREVQPSKDGPSRVQAKEPSQSESKKKPVSVTMASSPQGPANPGSPTRKDARQVTRSSAGKSSAGRSSAGRSSAGLSSAGRRTLNNVRSRNSAGSYRSTTSKENQEPFPPPTDPNMAQCPVCTRSFAKERIEKHQEICNKSSSKKRREFDPVKMRVQGTESEKFIDKIKQGGNTEEVPKQDWRKEHEEFVSNIRAAKQAQIHVAAGGKLSDLPPPPPSDTSHYVPCPHCDRRFNAAAAERHIPRCSAIVSNKPAFVAANRRR